MHKPLCQKKRILDPITHLPLACPIWARLRLLRVSDLRALVGVRLEDVPFEVRAGLPTMLATLLASWQAALQCAARHAEWMVSEDSSDWRV